MVRNRRSGSSRSARPRSETQDLEDRRHPGQPGDRVLLEGGDDPPRDRDPLLEHQRGANPHAAEQLRKPVAERELQQAEDAILRDQLQVLDDRIGGEGQVPVREHRALGLARGTGGEQERSEIGLQHGGRISGGLEVERGEDPSPARGASRLTGERSVFRVGDHQRRFDVGERRRQPVALDGRVERSDRGPGAQHPFDRDHCVHSVRDHGRDSVAAADAALGERRGERRAALVELAVGDRLGAVDHRQAPGIAAGHRGEIVGDRARSHPGACLRATKPTIASIEPRFSSVISTSVISIA